MHACRDQPGGLPASDGGPRRSADAPDLVPARTAAEVCRRFDPGAAARDLLRADLTPRQYLAALIAAGAHPAAVRFLAFALPPRAAVWWACRCAGIVDPGPPPEAAGAMEVAARWVAEPSEEHRRAALPAAEAAGLDTPAGCAAAAAYFSGGSLAPPDRPVVPPADDLTPRMAAGAVLLAAIRAEPERAAAKFQQFVAAGLRIADGTDRWPAAPPDDRANRDPAGPARPRPEPAARKHHRADR